MENPYRRKRSHLFRPRGLQRSVAGFDEVAAAFSGSSVVGQQSLEETATGIRAVWQSNEANRPEDYRDHFERLALWSRYLAWLALITIGGTWAYHLIAPPEWPRLPDEQVSHMQSILTGGVLTGLASGHVKRRLGG